MPPHKGVCENLDGSPAAIGGRPQAALTGCAGDDVRTMLRSIGLRPTRQRMALGRILFGKGDRHVTAEILYEERSRQKYLAGGCGAAEQNSTDVSASGAASSAIIIIDCSPESCAPTLSI
jgi:hypothetical protein